MSDESKIQRLFMFLSFWNLMTKSNSSNLSIVSQVLCQLTSLAVNTSSILASLIEINVQLSKHSAAIK
jgi:hypothetical protein